MKFVPAVVYRAGTNFTKPRTSHIFGLCTCILCFLKCLFRDLRLKLIRHFESPELLLQPRGPGPSRILQVLPQQLRRGARPLHEAHRVPEHARGQGRLQGVQETLRNCNIYLEQLKYLVKNSRISKSPARPSGRQLWRPSRTPWSWRRKSTRACSTCTRRRTATAIRR